MGGDLDRGIVAASQGEDTDSSIMTTQTFSPDQIAVLKAEFDMLDQDGDGRITRDELQALLHREAYAHLDQAQRQRILDRYAAADADRDAGVDFAEFLTLVSEQPDPRQALRESFDQLDLDGDGYLTAADFERVAALQGQAITTEQAESFIAMADRNADGKVGFDEYCTMMLSG